MSGRTVLLVDDHPLFRSGLRTLLEGQPWVGTILEAGSVRETVETARAATIDVAVMDLHLPDGDGGEATRRLLGSQRTARVLMLTMSDNTESVADALAAGARGYVTKLSPPEVIVAALETVAFGGWALGPDVDRVSLASRESDEQALPPPLNRLTSRELEVLTWLASGESNAVIARRQNVSDRTTRNQLAAICAKLEVADRLQAALLARDHGIGCHLTRENPPSASYQARKSREGHSGGPGDTRPL